MGGFSIGQASEMSGMLRAFTRDTKISLQYSSWYERLSKLEFPQFMRESFSHLMSHFYQENFFGDDMCGFSDIRMQDGSSFAVNDLLEDEFPGRFTRISPAAVELHAYYSLRDATTHYVDVAADSVSEYDFMPTANDAELENTLNLFDRGYGSLKRLHHIEEASGFFVVRLKNNTNPYILKVRNSDNDRKPKYFKQWLSNLKLKKRDYEFDVEFQNDIEFENLRLVALWNPNTKVHVFLLTNTNSKRLPRKMIGKIYRLRWQIELLFKELKSHTELRKFLTSNPQIAEGFIWASLCALMIRRFLVASAQTLSENTRLSFHKAAISARTFMPDFIRCALLNFSRLRHCLIDIIDFMSKNMKFSNPKRLSSFQIVGLIN